MSAISRQIFAGAATSGGTSPLLHRRVVVPPITRRSVTVQSNNSPISLVLRCPTRRRLPELRRMRCDCAVSSSAAEAAGGVGDWTAEMERRATRRSVTVQSNNSPISLVLRCPTRRRLPEMRRMRCDCAVSTAAAAGGEGDWTAEVEKKEVDRTVEVAIAVAATVVLGVANRVLYKLALVPLKQYPFFLAQLATFGYIVVYFSILYLRRQAGIVTKEMLSLPQLPYIAVGLLEALAAASGMAAGTMLSGASIPILSQTFLVWQLLLSAFFLGRRYNVNQLIGCFLVSMGVIITVASGSNAGPSLNDAGLFWTVLMVFSFFLQAADTIVKEVIFLNGSKQLKGRSVDLFVVNSFGSAYQALFICVLLPFLSKLWGIPFYQLPSYLKDGAACFLNVNNLSTGCGGAPLLPILFVIVNMGFNISLLHLLKISSAVVSCLASTVSVPLSVFVFTLPLPYLGAGTALPPGFVAGVVILVLGLIFYARKPAMVPATSPTS